MNAKKSYGQHFLVHESAASKIASFIDGQPAEANLLEIGPGKGMLTKYLIKYPYNFKAVEADQDMVTFLEQNEIISIDKIILLDCLKLNFNRVFDNNEFSIIGNFPYNISSQIVFKVINNFQLIPTLVGMFQKEVAERIVAPHGSKTYGVISVLTQLYYDGVILYNLSPGSFNPQPKVHSAVIKLTRKTIIPTVNQKLFRTIVKLTFNQRRKMIRNTLKPLVSDPAILENDFFNLRPEQISVQDFITLTNNLNNSIKHES